MNLKKIDRKSNKKILAGTVLVWLAGCVTAVTPAQATPFWGATASGSAKQFEITCGTCPNPVTTLSNQTDGGFGITDAQVDFSSPGLVSYSATAHLNGPNSLPNLGA